MTEYSVVLVTTSSKEEAERMAHTLVHDQLAACVNIVSPVQSVYRWEGKIHHDVELILVIKTRTALFADLAARVRSLHSYDNPEIIALPIESGSSSYLEWIRASTTQG